MEFTQRKAKRKPTLAHKQNEISLKCAKAKQSWCVDNWMQVIFIDESGIFIGLSDDAGIFILCCSNETDKDDFPENTNKFPNLFMKRNCMSFKWIWKMAIITQIINVQTNFDIRDNFFIFPLIQNWFGDELVFKSIMHLMIELSRFHERHRKQWHDQRTVQI